MKSWNPVWEDIFSKRDWGRYPDTEVVRFIARNFYKYERKSDVKILDLGSGTGSNTWYIAREGFDSYAIDGSVTAIDKLNNRMLNEDLKCSAIVGDIVSLPYEDSFFHGIIDVECMSTNRRSFIDDIIKEVYRTLKPEGRFYSQFFGTKTYGSNIGEEVELNTRKGIDVGPLSGQGLTHFTNPEEIREMFNRFKTVDIEVVERSFDGMKATIQEYIIVAEK